MIFCNLPELMTLSGEKEELIGTITDLLF